MARAPKLERRDDGDQDIQYQRGRPNGCGREAEQCHGGDVAGGAGVTDAGVEEGDDTDNEEQGDKVRVVHRLDLDMRMTNDE